MTTSQARAGPPKGSRGLGGARGFAREKHDFYPTPRALIDPLIARYKSHLSGGVWEPACGDGAICRVLVEHGIESVGTDLIDRGYGTARRDFLLELERPDDTDAIVTNPPFRLWREFAEHALSLRPGFVGLLGRLQLLEGKRASTMFRETGLSRVLISAGRVNMLPIVDGKPVEDKGHNGMIAWAWFCWVPDRAYVRPPEIEWFTPAPTERGDA